MINFPYNAKALRVDQRLGEFYVTVLPAELLLQVAASDRMSAIMNSDGSGYYLEGTQRLIQDRRLNEIGNYINRADAAFPNSIILAANYNLESGFDQGEIEDMQFEEYELDTPVSTKVWTVQEMEGGDLHLNIPTNEKLAAVIDGQHRLFAFTKTDLDTIRSMDLLCSVYIDLPKSLQAQIFATINSTQKRVDRSLTYELFGYNVSDEDEEYWTPDKLAVFFTRKLSTDTNSPLRSRIVVAPKRDQELQRIASEADWQVSTAVIVDGILRLFSSNPKRDSNFMRKDKPKKRIYLEDGPRDRSPMRGIFLNGNDELIYTTVFNYIKACDAVFWKNADSDSFITKTIGVQATFDILRKIVNRALEDKNISVNYFLEKIQEAGDIDFSGDEFRKPSGSGRTYIRKAIEKAIGIEKI